MSVKDLSQENTSNHCTHSSWGIIYDEYLVKCVDCDYQVQSNDLQGLAKLWTNAIKEMFIAKHCANHPMFKSTHELSEGKKEGLR
jgi:hypothetical protein